MSTEVHHFVVTVSVAVLLAIIAPSAAVAQAQGAAPNQGAADVSLLERQLAGAEESVAKLNREMHDRDPKLREVEHHLQELTATASKENQRHILVQKYLDAEEKKRPGARNAYELLKSRWFARTQAAYARDPQKSWLLRNYLTRDRRLVEERAAYFKRRFPDVRDRDFTDSETLWDTYVELAPRLERETEDYFQTGARQSGFPHAIIDQAKRDAEAWLDKGLYEAYIAQRTPPELLNGRTRVVRLRGMIELARQQKAQ